MLTIKTPLKNINELRKILMEEEIIARNYKILTEDNYGYIPIKKEINKKKMEKLHKQIKKNVQNNPNNNTVEELQIQIVEKNLEKVKQEARSITEQLKGKLEEKEIEDLKTSFDIIGDVVILEIPENLQNQKDIIGKSTLSFTKRKAIYMKKSAIEGVTRTRQLEHIAGEKIAETIHKEHGAKLKLNVSNVYFSPRLATERKRIAEQVKDGEIILDMFAGIGPFPILIAKDHNVDIYAIDINTEAVKYMEENIKINKLKGKITPILGDVNQIAKNKFLNNSNEHGKNNNNNNKKENSYANNIKFDRIIMNLPGTGKDFLDLAISLVKNNGIIHYYEFSEGYDSGIERITEIAKNYNKDVKVLATRKVKSSSPGQWHVVIDAKILVNY